MQAVLPRPDVAPQVEEGYVLLAADPDEPEAEVHALLFKLPNASMLPILIVAEPDGSFVRGSSGKADPASVRALLG